MISSPPGPSSGPSKTHLLPCGGVKGLGAPSLTGFPISPLPGQCINSQPWLRALTHRVAPPNASSPGVPAMPGPCYWLVASGTPVGWGGGCLALGLVRGAMCHYRLGGCSALIVCARCSRPVRGGLGRCRVLCLPRFPLPALRFLRCVWRAVQSGCPLSSLPGTPLNAVCAFRSLGPVAPLVFPACPSCMCALALSRRPRPAPSPC